MKCYRVYNRKLNKFAPRGRIDTIKVRGYGGAHLTQDQLVERFWNLLEWDEPYYLLGPAKRQLKYVREVCPTDAGNIVLIEFELVPVKEYTLSGNKLIENSTMMRLVYG